MQSVPTKGLKSRRLDLPPAVFLVVLAVLAGLAVASWAVDRSSSDDGNVAERRTVLLPSAADDARLIDENVNHPDVVGNRALTEVGYPDGVMEAVDVQLNRAVALAAVNPELAFGMARTVFLEQNIMLPGDVGHLDDRALSLDEIKFLEWNTFLPAGGAVALTPPGSDHVGMGVGLTRF